MRLKEFLKGFLVLVLLGAVILGLLAWVSGQVEAKPRQMDVNSFQQYFPLIIQAPTLTPTPLPTDTPVPSTCPAHNGDFELQIYDLINNAREDHGLAPLTPNYSLETSAGLHSDDMAVNHFMNHIGSDGSTPRQRMQAAGWTTDWTAEVIMYSATPQGAMDWWMAEGPGGAHYDTILGNLTDFGVGYAYCNNPSGGYFTVDFGHR